MCFYYPAVIYYLLLYLFLYHIAIFSSTTFLNLTDYFYLFTLEMKDNEELMGNISNKGKSSNFAIFASTKYLLLQALLSSHDQTIDIDI